MTPGSSGPPSRLLQPGPPPAAAVNETERRWGRERREGKEEGGQMRGEDRQYIKWPRLGLLTKHKSEIKKNQLKHQCPQRNDFRELVTLLPMWIQYEESCSYLCQRQRHLLLFFRGEEPPSVSSLPLHSVAMARLVQVFLRANNNSLI